MSLDPDPLDQATHWTPSCLKRRKMSENRFLIFFIFLKTYLVKKTILIIFFIFTIFCFSFLMRNINWLDFTNFVTNFYIKYLRNITNARQQKNLIDQPVAKKSLSNYTEHKYSIGLWLLYKRTCDSIVHIYVSVQIVFNL